MISEITKEIVKISFPDLPFEQLSEEDIAKMFWIIAEYDIWDWIIIETPSYGEFVLNHNDTESEKHYSVYEQCYIKISKTEFAKKHIIEYSGRDYTCDIREIRRIEKKLRQTSFSLFKSFLINLGFNESQGYTFWSTMYFYVEKEPQELFIALAKTIAQKHQEELDTENNEWRMLL